MAQADHGGGCGCSRRELMAATALVGIGWVLARGGRAALGAEVASKPSGVALGADVVPLSRVRLTGGPLKHAQELGMKNLMRLEPDRMMFYLRERAGLKGKGTEGYGSWDGPGRNLTGHIAGHYLSAVSYMYAATGDGEFKRRADYLVDELAEVQAARGNGYIGALMGNEGRGGPVVDGLGLFEEVSKGQIRSGGFDLNGMWSPWYVEHKIFAGLRDAYRQVGNGKALEISIKFAGWVESILSPLSEAQIQRMLATEFGGMNESLVDLYVDSGDERWLRLSEKFLHHAIVDPLANHQDILGGKHGNTQVPKLLGELARYIHSGAEPNGEAAKFFWEAVVNHHSFATGGHGYDEYFDAPDKLSDEIDGKNHRSGDLRTAESCNVYNMLKFTRLMFALEPDVKFAEFHERALFNHALASINFNDGQMCYMVPVGQGVTHEYQGDGFTCCVGTGLENHALHGEGIYYESNEKFWVNLFVPSTAESKKMGMTVEMSSEFPEGEKSEMKLTLEREREFTIALRRPTWAGEGYGVAVNGQAVAELADAGSYVELKRSWKTGDVVSFVLPKRLWRKSLRDNANRSAMMWGPLVLAADLGPGGRGGRRGTTRPKYPVFIADADEPVAQWMKPVEDQPGEFTATGTGESSSEITFRPFYQLSDRRYGIYWDVYTAAEWADLASGTDEAKRRELEAATVGFAQPGQMQSERDFNFAGDGSTVIEGENPGRRGGKWFSFDMPVEEEHRMKLIVTYSTNEQAEREFDVSIDGTKIKTEQVVPAPGAKFYDVQYLIPAELVKGKKKVTVRFEAEGNSEIAGVYGVRMVREDNK